MTKRTAIVLAGGGTAGHATPALAVGRELVRLAPELNIVYFGVPNSIEERLAVAEGFPFEKIAISPLRRGVILPNLAVPYRSIASVIEAMWKFNKIGVVGVFGSGGFSSWPATAAARQSGVPYFLEDGNAYPGLVTRLLHKRARKLYLAYKETADYLKAPARQVMQVGIPVSSRIFDSDRRIARKELGLDPERFTLLATGGSGGARKINLALEEVKTQLLEKGLNIIWQTGKQIETLPIVPEALRTRMIIERFIDPPKMALALQACDVSVSRCGMMSLAELAMVGKAGILVPFPFSAEGHQEANAKAIEAAGGGIMVKDSEFNGETLLSKLALISDEKTYPLMAAKMKSLAKPNAATEIAKDILNELNISYRPDADRKSSGI